MPKSGGSRKANSDGEPKAKKSKKAVKDQTSSEEEDDIGLENGQQTLIKTYSYQSVKVETPGDDLALPSLPGMAPQSQALPSMEEIMNWPGSDPVAGGADVNPAGVSVAFMADPPGMSMGPGGLLPLPAWLPQAPVSEDDLRCPKCDIVYYSKSSIKNHIQVCKYVRKTPGERVNGVITNPPAAANGKVVLPVEKTRPILELPRRVVVDGLIKLNEEEKGSLKILEKSCFTNDPEFYEDFHAPIDQEDKVKKTYATKKYRCKQCDEDFSGIKPFARHLYAHTFIKIEESELPQLCSGCGREFDSRDPLKKHCQESGAGTKCLGAANSAKVLLKCQLCSLRFTRKENMRKHLRQYAALARPMKDPPCFKCPLCPQIFGGDSLMKTHKLIHVKTQNQAVKCPACLRDFASKKTLQGHKRVCKGVPDAPTTATPNLKDPLVKTEDTDTKAPVFQCPHCPQSFKTKASLTGHSRVHSNYNKVWKCHWCRSVFYDETTLKDHIKTHDGQVAKAKVCKPCNRRFNNDHNLKLHLWHTHNMTLLDNEVWVKDPNNKAQDGLYGFVMGGPYSPSNGPPPNGPHGVGGPPADLMLPNGMLPLPEDLLPQTDTVELPQANLPVIQPNLPIQPNMSMQPINEAGDIKGR